MKIAAFLPVKGSSDRIPNKNTALLDGKPLFLHTLEKLLRCPFINEVWLDTESDDLRALADGLDCRHLNRDPRLAANSTDGHALYLNEVEHTDADIIVQILCTSPFILPETIQKGVEVLKNDPSYDSVVLVRREKQYRWGDDGPLYGLGRIPNSVDLPHTTIETMGMYMTRRETALRLRRRFGERPYLLEAEPEEAVDVNFPADFRLAQHIAAGRRERERNHFRLMQRHLSSPILSDILDDFGLV
jgi:CMP-N-acetylneuraminic acid synthetase